MRCNLRHEFFSDGTPTILNVPLKLAGSRPASRPAVALEWAVSQVKECNNQNKKTAGYLKSVDCRPKNKFMTKVTSHGLSNLILVYFFPQIQNFGLFYIMGKNWFQVRTFKALVHLFDKKDKSILAFEWPPFNVQIEKIKDCLLS